MRFSLRYIFVLVLLGVQLCTLVAILISSRFNAEKVLRDHTETVMNHLSTVAADNATRLLSPAGRTAEVSVALLARKVVGTDDVTDLETYFLSQLKENAEFSGVYLGQPDGSFLFVNRKGSGFMTKHIVVKPAREVTYLYYDDQGGFTKKETHPEDTYDPRERPWYQTALAEEGQIWTEPYMFFTSKQPGITAAKPVYSQEGELLGVVGVDIEISGLSSFFESVPISEHGSAFMMSADGKALAFPGINQALAKGGDQADLPHVSDLGDVPKALLGQYQSKPASVSNRRSFIEFEVDDTLYYGMVSPFGINSGDAFLRTFAEAVSQQLRGLGRVYRVGGDEFMAILAHTGINRFQDAQGEVQKAIVKVQQAGFVGSSVSVGLAALSEAPALVDLVRLSDQRMYQDKLWKRRKSQGVERILTRY